MLREKYRVIRAGHTHAGVDLAVDGVVELRPDVAELFPKVFQRLSAPAPAGRHSQKRAAAPAESPAPTVSTED